MGTNDIERQIKILLVDDEQIIRERLAKLLTLDDFIVSTAQSGGEAIDICKNETFAVVIADIKMPGISGIDVLKKIKKYHPETEVIMITGHGGLDTAIEALRAGAFDYITKPINFDYVEISINRAIEKKRMKGENKKLVETLVVKSSQLEAKRQELERSLKVLKKTQAQLLQSGKLAAIGELAGGVAHELNNPLSSVLTLSQLLIEKFNNLEEGDNGTISDLEEYLKRIVLGAQRSQTIVHSLLDFSRQSSAEFASIKLATVLTNTLKLLDNNIKKAKVELNVPSDEEMPLVHGNGNQLQQVFTNLIINACHAMPKGGTIDILVDEQGSKEGFVNIVFKDDGEGIEPQNIERIFEPFYTTKPPGKGTGLGLSLTWRIIQDHNGNLTVTSEQGEGTTFTISLLRGTPKGN